MSINIFMNTFNLHVTRVEQTVLEVTVMWVKHIPQSLGRRPNPFVKLLLLPQDTIMTTELKLEKNDAQYIEIFNFPLKSQDLTGSVLEVKVCDNKATRNAKLFGSVSIPLENLKLGQPVISWYHLAASEIEKDKISSLPRTTKPKKKSIIPKKLKMTQDDEDEMKENANDTF